jgi:hypothetical protein
MAWGRGSLDGLNSFLANELLYARLVVAEHFDRQSIKGPRTTHLGVRLGQDCRLRTPSDVVPRRGLEVLDLLGLLRR